eukprot:NODE_3504_length_2026_cov_8.302264.p1 GENE.NODE_3504_length_2026_cov_8.302264~~NODE_3504_length_2026_cov_8.302264.p1  ORF type:complete len:630 (-),score=278.14 NODE_3504_length_2026_cov_8.302264:135-1904(-)
MASATDIRKSEAATYAELKERDTMNIAALEKAIASITKGAQGAFLQTGNAEVLRNVVSSKQNMVEMDREAVLSFLSASPHQGYAPQSGEVNGILKQIKDDIEASFADATAEEEHAIKIYTSLMAAKKKEVNTLTGAIESNLERSGKLAVDIVNMKEDRADTEEARMEDEHFLKNLEQNCADHQAMWEERVKTRGEELAALADTIKVLNDDDSLELFKKTLAGSSSAFVQVATKNSALRKRALDMIRSARNASKRPGLDFIALALQGKSVGFAKVIKMIDDMAANLKDEQEDDDQKRKSCNEKFDTSDDKKKALENAISDLSTSIASLEEELANLTQDIEKLQKGIKAVDDAVAESTEQRHEEHVEFTEFMASDSAAKELLNYAKNRLHKFYNPRMHKAAAKRELGRDERIMSGVGGEDLVSAAPAPGGIANTGISEFVQISSDVAPPPPPETFGAYAKSSANTGVIAMMDLLIKDLDQEMQEAKVEEDTAQREYEQMLIDSKAKRAQDAKTLTAKTGAKAAAEAQLESSTEEKTSKQNDLKATNEYIASLHDDCDWLLSNYDVRKEARSSEIDALGKAKDVLKGASYEA